MALEKTWRWYGPKDPISLQEIRQTGATGIVTALHHIPNGELWTVQEIEKRKNEIERAGLNWSVVESVPVHEDIKKQCGDYKVYINNYKETIKNLGQCGIDTVCYNFMPVLDWSRTNLSWEFKDGSKALRFEMKIFAAFDLYILKREGAENDYSDEIIEKATDYYHSMDNIKKDNLTNTILLGLPGSEETYTLEKFREVLNEYDHINDEHLRSNLYYFLQEIIPIAVQSGVLMAIHPDDPPWPLLGLPRVLSDKNDVEKLLSVADSPANGLTLCTGSFGAGIDNDLVDIATSFASRINFVHLRNVSRNNQGDFFEDDHLNGDIDLYGVIKALLLEQKKRIKTGRLDVRLPMRPDHGHQMLDDLNKKTYPGYSLIGRMKGLAELSGLEMGIEKSLLENE